MNGTITQISVNTIIRSGPAKTILDTVSHPSWTKLCLWLLGVKFYPTNPCPKMHLIFVGESLRSLVNANPF